MLQVSYANLGILKAQTMNLQNAKRVLKMVFRGSKTAVRTWYREIYYYPTINPVNSLVRDFVQQLDLSTLSTFAEIFERRDCVALMTAIKDWCWQALGMGDKHDFLVQLPDEANLAHMQEGKITMCMRYDFQDFCLVKQMLWYNPDLCGRLTLSQFLLDVSHECWHAYQNVRKEEDLLKNLKNNRLILPHNASKADRGLLYFMNSLIYYDGCGDDAGFYGNQLVEMEADFVAMRMEHRIETLMCSSQQEADWRKRLNTRFEDLPDTSKDFESSS